ncbi:unnamed protein product, partial [Lepidochelys olivacea]
MSEREGGAGQIAARGGSGQRDRAGGETLGAASSLSSPFPRAPQRAEDPGKQETVLPLHYQDCDPSRERGSDPPHVLPSLPDTWGSDGGLQSPLAPGRGPAVPVTAGPGPSHEWEHRDTHTRIGAHGVGAAGSHHCPLPGRGSPAYWTCDLRGAQGAGEAADGGHLPAQQRGAGGGIRSAKGGRQQLLL